MIKLTRKPRAGDRVSFKWASSYMTVMNLTGKVEALTNGICKVLVDTPKGDLVPDRIPVFQDQCTAIFTDEAAIKDLIATLKLIRDQDQGCGGNVTAEQCWRNAQTLARDTVAAFDVRN